MYGYARVSVREPADKNLDLQVEPLVRAGCSMVRRSFPRLLSRPARPGSWCSRKSPCQINCRCNTRPEG